jgi:hypothetical protein
MVFGHPIYHIKCECGNYLAGYMNIKIKTSQDEFYVKSIITDYNLGGNYVKDEKQWHDYIKENYDNQNNRGKI